MKKLLFALLLILCFSCTKKEAEQPYTPTGFSVEVKQATKLSTGQVIESDAKCLIFVWKSDGKDFDLTKHADMMQGYVLDKNTGVSYKYDYAEQNIMSEKVSVGRYFVYVQRTNDGDNSQLAYSYTYFEVKDKEMTMLKKSFTTHVTRGSYEDWNAVE